MNPNERLTKAINFLQKQNPDLKYRHIMQRLGYSSPNYLSDLMRGEKEISDKFLNALEREFFVSKIFIQSGKGPLLISRADMLETILTDGHLPVGDLQKAFFEMVKKIAEMEATISGRPYPECLAEMMKRIV